MSADDNRRLLFAELDGVRQLLRRQPVSDEAGTAPAVDSLVAVFGLSCFERRVLLMCAGMELCEDFAELCAAASGARQPSFAMALAVLPDAHFDATSCDAPLRRYRLVEANGELLHAPLRIDERVLHHLLGVQSIDVRLQPFFRPFRDVAALPASRVAIASRMSSLWSRPRTGPLPVVQLVGTDHVGMLHIAATATTQIGVGIHTVRAADLPHGAVERDLIGHLWDREALLGGSALVIERDDHEPAEAARAAAAFAERSGLVVVVGREALPLHRRPSLRIDVAHLTVEDQRLLWTQLLGDTPSDTLTPVLSQFRLGVAALHGAAADALEPDGEGSDQPLARRIWRASRRQARPRLDDLAQRIDARPAWNELVLPAPQLRLLHDIAAHLRNTLTVYETWGFGARSARGLGITALFAGASGTGKTLAAEVLANELDLDLYKIDLSQVVSKYIGETEKNLRRIFDAAEEGGALLLFDEADALFGKRSEVKDSHDRYANLEISYLLQRMEHYRGLAILTTNMRSALDQAFLRRLRFIVEFPFPDAAQRAEIWRRAFPRPTPLGDLDLGRLSRLSVSGGIIRSIALNAAFLAADAGEPVGMSHLRDAARSEYLKLERPLDGDL
jgi:hypothetical protein